MSTWFQDNILKPAVAEVVAVMKNNESKALALAASEGPVVAGLVTKTVEDTVGSIPELKPFAGLIDAEVPTIVNKVIASAGGPEKALYELGIAKLEALEESL